MRPTPRMVAGVDREEPPNLRIFTGEWKGRCSVMAARASGRLHGDADVRGGPAALEAAAARAGGIVAFDAQDVVARRAERGVHGRLAGIRAIDGRLDVVECHIAWAAELGPRLRVRGRRLELRRNRRAAASTAA